MVLSCLVYKLGFLNILFGTPVAVPIRDSSTAEFSGTEASGKAILIVFTFSSM